MSNWENKAKVTRFDTEKQAIKYINKNPKYDGHPLKYASHVKDGWVVYYDITSCRVFRSCYS